MLLLSPILEEEKVRAKGDFRRKESSSKSRSSQQVSLQQFRGME
jgi:hypothetical protein